MSDPEAKVEFLRGLAAADFLPDGEAVGAVAAATGRPLADEGARGRHRAAVETFAREYWSLAPDERARRWNELSSRGWADDRATAARLAHLKAGLSIEPADYGDPVANALAPIIRDLYVLPPRERAVFRNARYESRDGDPHVWGNAAVKLRQAAPELVALEPRFLQRLIDTAWPPERELTPEQAFSMSSETYPTAAFRTSSADSRAPASKDSGMPAGGWAMVFVTLVLLKAVFSGAGDRSDSKPSYAPGPIPSNYKPSYLPNDKDVNDNLKLPASMLFRLSEVASFEQYEKNPVGPPPPRYFDWKKHRKRATDPPQNPPSTRP